MARKVALLGSTVAVLAFTCGFVGTKYLIEDESSEEQLSEVQASICSGSYKKTSTSCYSEKNSGYFREWLLWKDVDITSEDEWAAPINEFEEQIHAQRFNGVLPKLQQNALNALHADSVSDVDPAVLDAAMKSMTVPAKDADGEGGRRLDKVDTFMNPKEEEEANEEAEEAANTLDLFTSNSYTKNLEVNDEYPWTKMVEPYRVSTLELSGTDSSATYRWHIDDHVHGYGTSVEALFTDIGYHAVKVEEMVDSVITKTLVVKVMCKYVRREIRSLSNLDRETWLSAVAVLQHVPTVAGQALYGSKYMSKDAFTRVHLYYGGAMDCDHWHQGAGFVTSHVALTLQFEQALQSVNPSIAAPYWDFTLESTFFGSRDWRNSFIFSDDWFGNASPSNALHTVTSGRFQFVATLRDAKKYSYWINSYGLLRAPWNNDPTPFLTRSSKVYGYENNMKPSGCIEYRASLKQTTWMAMSRQLNSAAHGHIHELMGGAWNHYLTNLVHDEASPAIFTFGHAIQALSKVLWRYGYVECPEQCAMTDAAADCQCTCSASSLKGKSSLDILSETGILSTVSFFDSKYHKLDKTNFLDENGDPANPIPGYDLEATKHIHNNLLALLCNPGHIGDMYQATSTNDITFWTIHNTVDRLWHFKRLGNSNEYDETWDPYHKCYGHNPRNYQPFKNLFTTKPATQRRLTDSTTDSTDSEETTTEESGELEKKDGIAATTYEEDSFNDAEGHYYTNMELYEALHPASGKLQYTYDDFKWDHCAKIGFRFSNA